MKALRTCLTTLIVILTCGIAVHSQLNCSGGQCPTNIFTLTSGIHSLTLTASGTGSFITDVGGNLNLGAGSSTLWSLNGTTGALSSSNNYDIVGVTGNSSAAAGSIGEIVTQSLATGSSLTLATGSSSPIISMSLTAGAWEVYLTADYTANAATTVTALTQGYQVSNSCTYAPAIGAQDTFSRSVQVSGLLGTTDPALPAGPYPVSIASTTNVCLISNTVFAINSLKGYGTISARRMR